MAIAALLANAAIAKEPKNKARTPIAEFQDGFTLEQSRQFLSEWNLPTLLSGGDNAVWFMSKTSEGFRTAVLPVRQPTRELPKAYNPEIGKIKAETKHFGKISLDKFMQHPQSYAQAFAVIHKGKVVYENYPAMREDDNHLWASVAKPVVGLVIEQLISDGKIADNKTIGFYVPELRGSAWEQIKVVDVLDMTPGLDSEENKETRSDPNSIVTRVFLAEFDMPYNGKVELLLDVLKEAKVVRKPGTQFEYSSSNTQILVFLAEAVTQKRWAEIVDERIWSKMGAEGPLQIHTSPDGIALGHGLLSSNLRDMARFGMLFTPSWNKIASEQVVTPEILERLQKGVRSKEFLLDGFNGQTWIDRLNDDQIISPSRQWDAVWEDGDIWKSGMMSQGLYVSPKRDLVIVFFSVNAPDDSIHRYLRPIAMSGLFDK